MLADSTFLLQESKRRHPIERWRVDLLEPIVIGKPVQGPPNSPDDDLRHAVVLGLNGYEHGDQMSDRTSGSAVGGIDA